jgi:hypothetical protein
MEIERTKYKHTAPKSQVEYSETKISLGSGINRFLETVSKLIEKYFGILYMNRSYDMFV